MRRERWLQLRNFDLFALLYHDSFVVSLYVIHLVQALEPVPLPWWLALLASDINAGRKFRILRNAIVVGAYQLVLTLHVFIVNVTSAALSPVTICTPFYVVLFFCLIPV